MKTISENLRKSNQVVAKYERTEAADKVSPLPRTSRKKLRMNLK